MWWRAWDQASAGILDGVEAVAVGGQQHGMVLVDETGTPVRDALLWNDNRSAPQAATLIEELGGPQAWADTTGIVPVASFTVTKLRWVAEHEPDVAARAQGVLLPHDWITHQLRGGAGEPTTDRGDASGTGYWSAADERLPSRPAAHGVRPRPGRAPGGRAPGGGRRDARRDRAGPRHRGQHGRRPRPRPRARRRRGVPRHQRDRVRRVGPAGGRPLGHRRRLRRRDRSVPAAGLHAERGPGDRGRAADGRRRAHRPGPARPLGRGHRGPGAAALPRRRAHPRAARRDRPAARPDPPQRDARRTWSGPRSRACSAASPTRSRRSPPPA